MVEALWSVEFGSNVGMLGAGIVIFETGRILGGDSAFMYVGSYKVENGIISGDIKVKKYNDLGDMQSIFGPLNEFNLSVSGKVDYESMTLSGPVVENTQLQITIQAKRREELPQ